MELIQFLTIISISTLLKGLAFQKYNDTIKPIYILSDIHVQFWNLLALDSASHINKTGMGPLVKTYLSNKGRGFQIGSVMELSVNIHKIYVIRI